MKQNLFVRNGRPLVSKVAYKKNLKESIELSVSLIGGIKKLVKKGDIILLKPNYNTADPYPGSSDPEFIKTVIDMLYKAGAGKSNFRRKNRLSSQSQSFGTSRHRQSC